MGLSGSQNSYVEFIKIEQCDQKLDSTFLSLSLFFFWPYLYVAFYHGQLEATRITLFTLSYSLKLKNLLFSISTDKFLLQNFIFRSYIIKQLKIMIQKKK